MGGDEWQRLKDRRLTAQRKVTRLEREASEASAASDNAPSDEDGSLLQASMVAANALLIARDELATLDDLVNTSKSSPSSEVHPGMPEEFWSTYEEPAPAKPQPVKQTVSWASQRYFGFMVPGVPISLVWPRSPRE